METDLLQDHTLAIEPVLTVNYIYAKKKNNNDNKKLNIHL